MYRTDVWDVDVVGGAPVESVDWTAAAEPGALPETGATVTPSAAGEPNAAALALGIGLLFVFGMARAATPPGV